MTWAQPLKRVFDIDLETCAGCGGKLRVIARMLTHLEKATCRPAQGEGIQVGLNFLPVINRVVSLALRAIARFDRRGLR